MSAFNVVRFRVKPGYEVAFVDAHRRLQPGFEGFLGGNLVKTGDRSFCMVGQWQNFDVLAAARPQMIALLDSFRHMLEDLGGDLGVTDPVSGESVASLAAPAKAARPAKKAAAKKKAPAKKAKAKAKKKPAAKKKRK